MIVIGIDRLTNRLIISDQQHKESMIFQQKTNKILAFENNLIGWQSARNRLASATDFESLISRNRKGRQRNEQTDDEKYITASEWTGEEPLKASFKPEKSD